ncbi:MAG TPA: hypothetical protein VFB33_11220 [Candidatus Binataceae bacterium]|nr:hypothetical protein [Candidatus Binataceae bacterium]
MAKASMKAAGQVSALALDTLERAVLAAPVAAFAEAAREPAARARWAELAAAIDALEVPAPLLEQFGALVEAALTSGRVRREHGPGAELSLRALYLKTPRGRAAAEAVEALNAALSEFAGRPLDAVSVAIRGPGAWALTLQSARARIVVRFAHDGVQAESVELG